MERISTIKISKIPLKQNIILLRKSTFLKNMLIIMSGTGIAQVVGYSLSPIISRLFSPSDFGVFGSFNSIISIIAAGITLDYSQAIMLPKEKRDAINVFFVSWLSTFIISCIFLLFFLIFPSKLYSLIKINETWILLLIVIAIIIIGINSTCQAWCVRIKAFKQTSASQVIRSLSSNGSQIGFGFLNYGGTGLIVSSIMADILAGINLIRIAFRDFLSLRHYVNWISMKHLAKEYKDFPMYSASQNVINAFSSGLPVLLLSHFYGIQIAGIYAFGIRVLHIPMGFVLGALRQVLFQKASETQHQGGLLSPLYLKVTGGLFILIFLPSLCLFLWGPNIFVFIFGNQWYKAGEVARWLILWLMFYFCNLPAVLFARLIRIQKKIFFYDLILLTARISVLVLGGWYLSAMHTIKLFSFISGLMNLILIFLVGVNILRKEGKINYR